MFFQWTLQQVWDIKLDSVHVVSVPLLTYHTGVYIHSMLHVCTDPCGE
jgi:hypothetical protein